MPRDNEGRIINVGDRILVPALVTEVRQGDAGQNVAVRLDTGTGTMNPAGTFWIDGHLTRKEEAAGAATTAG